MKVKLNVMERLMAMGILPKEGNFVTLKTIRDTTDKLGLTEAELKDFEVKQDGDKVNWNPKGNEEIEFELGERAVDLFSGALKKLSEDNKLTQQHFSLYEKFIDAGGN